MAQALSRASRRRRTVLQIVVGVIVLAVAAALVLSLSQRSGTTGSASGATPTATATATGTPAAAAVARDVADVPASVFDQVGVGTAQAAPTPLSDAPALTSDGKPEVLYVGGEFCPYCAAERWGLAVALERFGDLHDLGTTTSSSSDTDPNTATLDFHGASFTSDYLSFTGKETVDRDRNPLDSLTGAEQKIVDTYDAPPYTDQKGTIPFVDIGGVYLLHGAQYDPSLLQGKTHAQIAAALDDPDSAIAKAVIGTANTLTVAICAATGDTPAAVCGSSGVKAAAAAMKAAE
ncbi:DUF929 family protein [Gryllotalpicola ginsengisoli]|uniref:DUF929 family protein n=1 Tax=Gryllotalpicola ginsengisoli TaxID=444608 RepID=UPI0003B6E0B9|nr:DUF929 family protein [Gryllotalpicola ginsengisoli]